MGALSRSLSSVDAVSAGPRKFGRVRSVVGLLVEATGLDAAVGELCYIYDASEEQRAIKAEVVGIKSQATVLMPLERTVGLSAGCLVGRSDLPLKIAAGPELLGRVIDANGTPLDGKGPIDTKHRQSVHRDPPSPMKRDLIKDALPTGVRAIDAFLSVGRGQRTGIFAGSGVGKSTLLGMIAREAQADVNVIALIGERGREVREFIHDNLTPESLQRTVVIAVTGDEAAMSRVKGAEVALAVAEYFRDQDLDVLLMMDSLTRVAMAQREIGLAVGEPPTTRGYTPSVFTLLPRLLERAGPAERGSITGLFTVLVDGDDFNEPISDAARGLLDGHIVLSRKIAEEGHFPAIDVPASVSRIMPRVTSEEDLEAAREARKLLAAYREVEDLISVGAYEKGSDPEVDRAVSLRPDLEAFLQQKVGEVPDQPPSERLKEILAQKTQEPAMPFAAA